MEKLGKYIKPYVWYIALTVGIKLLGAVLELMIPYFMEVILDDVVPTGEITSIFLYGGLMLLCAAGCVSANIGANRMSAISSGKITRKLRHDLFEKLEHLSAGQMDRLTISSAVSRLTSDTYNINQFLARMQRLGIRAPMLLLGGVCMMLKMDAALALVLGILFWGRDSMQGLLISPSPTLSPSETATSSTVIGTRGSPSRRMWCGLMISSTKFIWSPAFSKILRSAFSSRSRP